MNKKLYKLMNWPEIESIVYSESDNPHAMLGAHVVGNSVLVQTFQPGAKEVRLQILDGDKSYKMEMADESGYFAVLLPGKTIPAYEYIVEKEDGSLKKVKDAYNFEPRITRQDTEIPALNFSVSCLVIWGSKLYASFNFLRLPSSFSTIYS